MSGVVSVKGQGTGIKCLGARYKQARPKGLTNGKELKEERDYKWVVVISVRGFRFINREWVIKEKRYVVVAGGKEDIKYILNGNGL